ncbi:hypothetical protein BJ508DRAFT_362585 [Ascobolus immersus RN42]|uniref:Transmembrane protein n=1 Tax=Ascobolus immersus RN42 TaxID=1160509 RepID=A0A3N4I4S3_ASCIM|nr:hypothetical protein BJ508DRAFT_362585 [Ascobolus immersus RN42]
MPSTSLPKFILVIFFYIYLLALNAIPASANKHTTGSTLRLRRAEPPVTASSTVTSTTTVYVTVTVKKEEKRSVGWETATVVKRDGAEVAAEGGCDES